MNLCCRERQELHWKSPQGQSRGCWLHPWGWGSVLEPRGEKNGLRFVPLLLVS